MKQNRMKKICRRIAENFVVCYIKKKRNMIMIKICPHCQLIHDDDDSKIC